MGGPISRTQSTHVVALELRNRYRTIASNLQAFAIPFSEFTSNLYVTYELSESCGRVSPTESPENPEIGVKRQLVDYLPGVAGRHAIVGLRSPALQRVSPIDDPFAGDGKLADPVILLFDAGVRHAGHPGPLLRKAELIGTVFGYAVRSQLQLHRALAPGRPNTLRPAMVWTSIPVGIGTDRKKCQSHTTGKTYLDQEATQYFVIILRSTRILKTHFNVCIRMHNEFFVQVTFKTKSSKARVYGQNSFDFQNVVRMFSYRISTVLTFCEMYNINHTKLI